MQGVPCQHGMANHGLLLVRAGPNSKIVPYLLQSGGMAKLQDKTITMICIALAIEVEKHGEPRIGLRSRLILGLQTSGLGAGFVRVLSLLDCSNL